ncbi:MAG: hypothetical protein WBZ36_26145 [Candidatus Nitrosopolaris sp.]|jgi:hypothetical protein
MMASQDIVRVSWYLPEKIVYHIKHLALNQRTDFSAFVTELLQKRLDDPKEVKLEEWHWRGSRMTTVYLPNDLWARVKDMAEQRDIPVNSLIYSILIDADKGRKIKYV